MTPPTTTHRLLVPTPGTTTAPTTTTHHPTIVVFPHAGGSPRQYASWAQTAGDRARVLGVTYPGRDHRLGEPHPARMQDLADDIAAALATEFPSTDHPDSPPIILAGHSLGAILAYETLLAWQHTGGGLGVLLVISGQTSPHYAGGGTVHLAADQHIIEEVSRSGPETARALADPELAALYLPAIREDYRLIETYSPHPRVSGWTSSTIVIAKGYGDKELSAVSTTGWRHLSPDVIGPVTVPGDHMHHIRRPELAQLCCGGLLRDAARTPQRKARS